MWFLFGWLAGRAAPTPGGRFWSMVVWTVPVWLSQLAVERAGAWVRAPALLAGWAVMALFVLHRPSTSDLKLDLIGGAVGWARLVLLFNLVVGGFMLFAATGMTRVHLVGRALLFCVGAAVVEGGLDRWVERDVARRGGVRP